MKTKFQIIGMTCASCQSTILNYISSLSGVNNCNVNLINNTMLVNYDENKLSCDDIINNVRKIGFDARILDNKLALKTYKHTIIKLIINFALLLSILYFSMGAMINILPNILMLPENRWILVLIQCLICIPSFFINAKTFINGYKNLFKLHPNMNSLVSIGCTASFGYGVYNLIMIFINTINFNVQNITHFSNNIYFESFVMILTFVSLGKFIEEISKNNASRSLEDLISLVPSKVKILKNNIEEYIDINKVNIGDIIVCKKGDIIPLDGNIVKGAATIDQSNFTGESLPVTKNEKDSVISGTTILNGYLNIVCTTTSENSSFKTLIDSINKSSESKPPITKITDKIAKYFVPVIMCISIISFGIYLICTHDLELSLNFGISVLVVACPCALALATPIAIMVGTSSAAKNGILIKSGDILQKNGNIKCVAFDKTGTLTNGKPVVTDFINIKEDKNILNIAYSMEIYSNHPLSNAITDYSLKNNIDYIELEDIEEIDGKGIVSKLNNDVFKFGNQKFVDYDVTEYEYLSKQGKTVLYLFKNDILYAVIAVKDQIKDGAKETIDCLKKKNIKTILITGDNSKTANVIANELGINEVYSEILPKDKANIIKEIESKYGTTAMVGDGVNDALALIESDIGITVGNGSDIAVDKGDIVLLRNNIFDVYNSIVICKRILNAIKFNLFWVIFYNSICVLIASGALYPLFNIKINPMIASLLMSISSLFVWLTSMTLTFQKSNNTNNKDNINLNGNIELEILGMKCEHCVQELSQLFEGFDKIKTHNVSLKENKAYLTVENLDSSKLLNAISKIGFKGKLIKPIK